MEKNQSSNGRLLEQNIKDEKQTTANQFKFNKATIEKISDQKEQEEDNTMENGDEDFENDFDDNFEDCDDFDDYDCYDDEDDDDDDDDILEEDAIRSIVESRLAI